MSDEQMKRVASALGVPDTMDHIVQRIGELMSEENALVEQIYDFKQVVRDKDNDLKAAWVNCGKLRSEVERLREIGAQSIWVIAWWRFKTLFNRWRTYP